MAKSKPSKPKNGKSSHALVIVESPAKARTISKYLGSGFTVEASIGHVRDLPQGAAQIPAEFKGESWSNLGVNVNDNFTPIYIVPPGKSKQIKLLKDRLKEADALYLATDEDREGEAISWHLLEILKPKVPVHRLVFHEITKDAIQAALASPRDVDDGHRKRAAFSIVCTAMRFRRCCGGRCGPSFRLGVCRALRCG
jgi:DNA topoisomerase-1